MSVRLPESARDLVLLASLPDPYPIYRALRAHAPVHRIAERNTVLVSRYADCEHVLRTPEVFSSAAQAGMDPVLIGADPPAHTPIRRALARILSPAQTARLEPFVRETARALLDGLAHAGPRADLVEGYAIPLPFTVMRELLQVDPSVSDRFRLWTDALSIAANATFRTMEPATIQRLLIEFSTFLVREHFPRCAEAGRTGLVSDLLAGRDFGGQPLRTDRLVSLFRFFTFAGIETTRHVIGNAILAFQAHPPAWTALQAAPRLLPRAIEEVIRFDTPVQLIQRTVAQDTVLAGVPLARGTTVGVLLGSANRDEAQFAEPDRFWIDRPEVAHLGFGAGPHFCLGSHLARMEARVAFEELFVRWPKPPLLEPPETLPRAHTFTTRGPARLPVAFA